MTDAMFRLLGLAKRANKVVSGAQLFEQLRKRTIYLVLVAENASERSKKQFCDKSSFVDVEVGFVSSSTSLSKAVGLNNRMAIGISDRGFANQLLEMLKNEGGAKYEKQH